MKFTFAAVALCISSAIAVSTADLPSCAIPCFQTAISQTSCSITDTHCQCTTGKDSITASAGPCLIQGCSTEDAAKTLQVSTEICDADAKGSGAASSSTASATGTHSSTASAAAKATTNAASWIKADILGAGVGLVAAGMMGL